MDEETRRRVLSDEQIATYLANMDDSDERAGYLRLAFLPEPDVGWSNAVPAYFAGDKRHVEINFPSTGRAPYLAFTAYSGTFHEPENAGFIGKCIHKLRTWLATPTTMRGTFLQPRTYEPPKPGEEGGKEEYEFIGIPITFAQEAALFRECAAMHGQGFNRWGFYRSVIPGLDRTSDDTVNFCSEAVVKALQRSGVLEEWVGHLEPWILAANPGGITPARLYDTLRPYSTLLSNQVFPMQRTAPADASFFYLGDASASSRDV